LRAIPPNRADIQHASSEFDESSTLDWNFDRGQVMEGPVQNSGQIILPKKLGKALLSNELAIFIRSQAIFWEAVIKQIKDVRPKLLHLLLQIWAADEANRDFPTQFSKKFQHLRAYFLS